MVQCSECDASTRLCTFGSIYQYGVQVRRSSDRMWLHGYLAAQPVGAVDPRSETKSARLRLRSPHQLLCFVSRSPRRHLFASTHEDSRHLARVSCLMPRPDASKSHFKSVGDTGTGQQKTFYGLINPLAGLPAISFRIRLRNPHNGRILGREIGLRYRSRPLAFFLCDVSVAVRNPACLP